MIPVAPNQPRFRGTVPERPRDLRRFPGREHRDQGDCRILRGFRLGARRFASSLVAEIGLISLSPLGFFLADPARFSLEPAVKRQSRSTGPQSGHCHFQLVSRRFFLATSSNP
jgi:hypothetical protein